MISKFLQLSVEFRLKISYLNKCCVWLIVIGVRWIASILLLVLIILWFGSKIQNVLVSNTFFESGVIWHQDEGREDCVKCTNYLNSSFQLHRATSSVWILWLWVTKKMRIATWSSCCEEKRVSGCNCYHNKGKLFSVLKPLESKL